MPEFHITDLALFLVSLAACIYCVQLSRRLKSLQDTRDGLGATIMAMTKSVSAVSSATQETRNQAGELAAQLSKLMKEADETCDRLEAQIARADGAAAPRRPATRPAATYEEPARDPEPARLRNGAEGGLDQLIDEMRARQERLKKAARNGDFLFEDEETWVTQNHN
ncbi:hypothetical protein D1224_05525 [Henriciella barbarensis]|uniref:DUF6468 domain-containing protein n=1 Tax=Henriciella barbarensis TaxID=86342 RepID=A0A399QYV6_9PROT|nr:DUF6468 domain-containing protein [Henriciella barbarensis]RIJ23721.1 hypothetical protein D1224_05525 [Henriciella barbarensis]